MATFASEALDAPTNYGAMAVIALAEGLAYGWNSCNITVSPDMCQNMAWFKC